MIEPIRPEEVGKEKAKTFPAAVFAAFNELIAQKYVGKSATIYQDDVLALIEEKDSTLTRGLIFQKGYLNVEDAYRDYGWTVVYDKPAYNETGRAYFKFTRKEN